MFILEGNGGDESRPLKPVNSFQGVSFKILYLKLLFFYWSLYSVFTICDGFPLTGSRRTKLLTFCWKKKLFSTCLFNKSYRMKFVTEIFFRWSFWKKILFFQLLTLRGKHVVFSVFKSAESACCSGLWRMSGESCFSSDSTICRDYKQMV